MADEYEVLPGTPEQVEVFVDLQRMLIKLYNLWPEDIAIAVYASACGSVVAMIEQQYKVHVAECPHCQEEGRALTVDLVATARNNFDYYYERGRLEADHQAVTAADMVNKFFNKEKH